MRNTFGRRRAWLGAIMLLVTALAIALAVPALSFGAPVLTVKASTSAPYMTQPFYVTGTVKPSVPGKIAYVEFRKAWSLRWSSAPRVINAGGGFSYLARLKSSGTWYFRTRYGTSRSSSIKVYAKPQISLVLASTTSTQDSGLFDVLIPAFEKAAYRYNVKVIAVGSGEALKLGEKKDADVLLVHSPAAEKTFVANGYGKKRRAVMHNDFLLVGPKGDPGDIAAAGDIVACFKKIDSRKVTFVSRGDNSGTHTKEKSIWDAASLSSVYKSPYPSWYKSTGQGMGETLKVASELPGYTIVDRATWVTNRPSDLIMVQQKDSILSNPYTCIEVVGAKNAAGAAAFNNWIVGNAAQNLIFNFGYAKYHQHLFWPDAD